MAARGRPDLADRAILLMLAPIAERQRRPEHALWREFELARPHILGALLDAAAQGLHLLPRVRLQRLPRMADFALWAWTGSASDLLQVVGTNRSGWPKSPRALAGRLRRAQAFLRTLGIEIAFGREGRFGTRTIRITAIDEDQLHDTVSTVSRVSDNGRGGRPKHSPPSLEQAL